MINAKVMPINIKRLFHTFLVSTFLAFLISPDIIGGMPEDPPKGIRTVVIDAGHGGRGTAAPSAPDR